jgi:Protein of unknown function (DUF4238)
MILMGRPWQVWRAPESAEFITSDNPVITMLPIGDQFAPGFGFNSSGVLVAFPLSPTSCLIIGRGGQESRQIDAKIVAQINELQLHSIFRNAYSRSRLQVVEGFVDQHAGDLKFGENAFLVPGDRLPAIKNILRIRIEHYKKRG